MSDGKPSILVVEDEPIIAMDLADAFEDAGWAVIGPAGTLENAEAAINGQPPDAAVLDMNLRGASTHGLAETLRAMGVPVVFLTGAAEFSLPDTRREVGVLFKPTPTEDVIAHFEELKR